MKKENLKQFDAEMFGRNDSVCFCRVFLGNIYSNGRIWEALKYVTISPSCDVVIPPIGYKAKRIVENESNDAETSTPVEGSIYKQIQYSKKNMWIAIKIIINRLAIIYTI